MVGSRLQVNKPHKTRFASKAARLQRNKMMREQKRVVVVKEKRASFGSRSPPRVIVLDVESCNVKALYQRVQSYMEVGELHLAKLDIKKALEVDPLNGYTFGRG